jgi:hypothetical protein
MGIEVSRIFDGAREMGCRQLGDDAVVGALEKLAMRFAKGLGIGPTSFPDGPPKLRKHASPFSA